MTMDEQTVESDAWAVISNLRDQHPRLPDDCPTDDIVVALAAAGLLAAPAAQPAPFTDLTARLAAADAGWGLASGDGPSNPDYIRFLAAQVDAFEDHASPAAPADDEAMIERMARASWYASDGFITGLPWPVTGFRAEKERRRVRGALAAYLGQPWYVGQEVEWNPTGDEWKTGFITRLSGDNAGITLHDNAQPLTVSTRNLRSALAALREGQQ